MCEEVFVDSVELQFNFCRMVSNIICETMPNDFKNIKFSATNTILTLFYYCDRSLMSLA